MLNIRLGVFVTAAIAISYLYTIAETPAATVAAGELSPSATAAGSSTETSTGGEPNDSTGIEATELDDLIVVQNKKLVQNDGAKLTYNVSEDPESKSGTLLDILRKVPGITVDANDEVKVNGQSNFKILINNREDPMLKGDIKTVLKSLPAGSIRKIEVISEPGAKYEAEGTGGILNIVTDRGTNLSGFNTRFNAWMNSYNAGGSANGRVKIGKVMLGANVNYNNGYIWPRTSSSHIEIEDHTGSENHLNTRDRKTRDSYDYTGVNIDMSWEPDTLNLFTLSANFSDWTNSQRADERNTMFTPSMTQLWSMDRSDRYRYHSLGGGFQMSYQHTFGRHDNTLVASYMFDGGRNSSVNTYHTTCREGDIDEMPWIRKNSSGDNLGHIIQIDYSNQLGPRHKLEAGAKASIDDNSNFSRAYAGLQEDDLTEDSPRAVKVSQFKDIYAAYASYTGSYAKIGVTAGLRFEHTRMGLHYKLGDFPDFTTYLNDLVPNAAFSYNFTDASALRLAYQTRIGRPGISRLNPYRDTSTPAYVQYGNPNLESERSHYVSIGYTNYDHPLSGGVKLGYRYLNNSINDILFMRDGVMNSTFANVGKQHEVSGSLDANWRINDNLQWSAYFGVWYEYMKADTEVVRARNKGWNYNVNSNINYTLPCKVRLSAYGGWYSGWLDLQSKGGGSYWYGLGASRSWLKNDALTLSLSLGNLFPTHRSNGYTQSDGTVTYSYNSRFRQWHVGMSVSFSFGGLTANVKRTAANVEKESQGGDSKK